VLHNICLGAVLGANQTSTNPRCSSGNNGLLVTYNINNGVQFVGRPQDPPPYSEIIGSPPIDGPPPPYTSVEDVRDISDTVVMSPTDRVVSITLPSHPRSDNSDEPCMSSEPLLAATVQQEQVQSGS